MKKAFTLIEILVTSLILSITIMGMLWIFVYCHKKMIENFNIENAIMIMDSHFENIQRCESEISLNQYLSVYSNVTETRQILFGVTREYVFTVELVGNINPSNTNELSILKGMVTWDNGTKNIESILISNEPN
jgi:prepilin-type N-terminal cleavage/methylation domain-containing protein